MKYFVTGATGFVGGRVVRRLVERGDEVLALARNPGNANDLAALGVQVVPGDVTDKESMRAPMAGVDGVFHIAGWYKIGARDSRPGQAINVEGTRNVVELVRDTGVPKCVYTSTLAVNSDTHGALVDESYHFSGRHLTEYDRTKAEAHAIAHRAMAQRVPIVVVMPGLIYGPGDTSTVRPMLRQFLAGRLPAIPSRTAYSWAHVDDIATAHLLAMDQGRTGEDYIIAGPTHTLAEALGIAARWRGVKPPRTLPPQLFGALSPVMGVVGRVVPVPSTYSAEGLRVVSGVTYTGTNAKARGEWGYEPRPLEIGLIETLQHELALGEE